jgi:hypothetical protein
MPFEEATALADVVETVIKTALAPITARLRVLEARAPTDEPIAALRERVAGLEARPMIPGPPGESGPPGADGLGFDTYTVDYDGERTFTHRWTSGEKTIAIPFRVPLAIYRGVFLDGKIYEHGDLVTVNGSIYHCDADTMSRPGDGSKDWTLAVKRGKDDRMRREPWPK